MQRLAVGEFFSVPGHDNPDSPALELLGVILSQGNDSRLARVVADEARASAATQGGILGDRRGPEVFGLFAVAAQGVSTDSLGTLLASAGSLGRNRRPHRSRSQTGKEHLSGNCGGCPGARPVTSQKQVLHAALFHGSGEEVNAEVGRVMAVTLADVRRVAKTWLVPENALVLLVNPGAGS